MENGNFFKQSDYFNIIYKSIDLNDIELDVSKNMNFKYIPNTSFDELISQLDNLTTSLYKYNKEIKTETNQIIKSIKNEVNTFIQENTTNTENNTNTHNKIEI